MATMASFRLLLVLAVRAAGLRLDSLGILYPVDHVGSLASLRDFGVSVQRTVGRAFGLSEPPWRLLMWSARSVLLAVLCPQMWHSTLTPICTSLRCLNRALLLEKDLEHCVHLTSCSSRCLIVKCRFRYHTEYICQVRTRFGALCAPQFPRTENFNPIVFLCFSRLDFDVEHDYGPKTVLQAIARLIQHLKDR